MRTSIALVLAVACAGCGGREAGADGAQAAADSQAAPVHPLLDLRAMSDTAPPQFRARFETSAGPFVVEVHRDWSPRGADRFYNLVQAGYYDSMYVHRVLPFGIAQFGFYKDPRINNVWLNKPIGDDPPREANKRGRIVFAHSGLNTRSAQVFINLQDQPNLDEGGFVPFGEVVEGMESVDKLYDGYGELAPEGKGPDPGQAGYLGNPYFQQNFPELSLILSAGIETAAP